MKRFKFAIRGNDYDVEVRDIEDNVAEVEVNGTVYQVDIKLDKPIIKTPKLVRSITTPNNNPGQKTNVPTASTTMSIKSPLPGTILEIKRRVGDTVKVGDTILIMEAMKMENDIKADIDGVISAIKVNVNDSVLEGDVLVEIGGN
ncbi:MAG: acetyl-CoA carboxylase biotin carboxyl carrier protein subunit [Candidatus Kapabacteria bacterium]|nr:acetyl-CoA carboxylase biotin carboxyl carrier protein subunit [Ignavibacteriota bacterium]MCW5885842.1 acetyl-CoA carboxylase biotin carboxyl carrier protein subunit [Candidatus Kapabacteria bacterium]